MKKTLTVNLGGTVFHIDEDAYHLLDQYLCNLKLHFKKQEGADEIISDIEMRISELFLEKINQGIQVITIQTVEEVIQRMGKPEEFAEEKEDATENRSQTKTTTQKTRKRLYRNPDDKILGGVIGGIAAYLGVDTNLLRLLLLIVLVFGVGTLIPIYLICWIIIPQANTAEEKLKMRGEEVTVESIGKTVTEGFEKVTNNVNEYMNSSKPRNFFRKLADVLVTIAGVIIKVCLIIIAIVLSPVLFVLAMAFIILIIAIITAAIGGWAALYALLPSIQWEFISGSPMMSLITSIAGILLVGIPLMAIIIAALGQVFNWKPMSSGLKWTLFILWVVGIIVFILGLGQLNWEFPYFAINV